MSLRRAAVLAMSLVVVGAGLQAPVVAQGGPTVVGTPLSPEAAALQKARETGQPVEVAERTTELEKLSVTPQGLYQLETSPVPVRAEQNGVFRDIDLTLERRGEALVPKVSAVNVAFGAGGDNRLVTMAQGAGSLTLTWPGGSLPEPVLDGPNATYVDAAGPGADLVVSATPTGLAHYVVVKTPQAARNPELAKIEFGVSASGVRLRQRTDGGVAAVDAAGQEVFSAASPVMWEGTVPAEGARTVSPPPDEVTAGPAPGSDVRVMDVEIGSGTLAVVPDPALLKAPEAKFPIVIDPSWQTWNAAREGDDDGYGSNEAGWAYVDRSQSSQSYWKPTRLPTGREDEDGTDKRSYIRMNVDLLHRWAQGRRVKVHSAEITFDTQHAWSCTGRDVRLANVDKFYSTTTWENRPDGHIPEGSGWADPWLATAHVKDKGRPECGDDGEANNVTFRGANLTRLVQWATDHEWDIFPLGIYPDADINDTHTWKVFDPDPRMVVEYSRYPDQPTNLQLTGGGTTPKSCVQGAGRPWVGAATDRQLWADIRDVDGDATGGATGQPMRARFELYQEYNDGGGTVVDNWSRYFPEDGTPADGPWWQASKDGGTDAGIFEARLAMQRQDPSANVDGGTLYRWRVQGEDDTLLSGAWSPWCEFMVDDVRPKAPTVVSAQYPSRKWSGYDAVQRTYKPGTFTFGPGGSGDVVKYHYKFSDGTEGDAEAQLGQPVSLPWTPKRFGMQWVEVTSYDRAGNASVSTVKYEFGVEQPPRDAAWSMDDTTGNLRAIGQTGVTRPNADLVVSGGLRGEPGNLGPAVPADRSLKLNGAGQFGEVRPVLETGTSGQVVPLVDTSKRFMLSTWVKLASTSGDRVAVSQAAEDGSVFELGWIGGRWALRHRRADGTVLATVTRNMAQAGDGTAWTAHWVSLMGGYDPIRKELWLRTQAEGSTEVCSVPDEPWNCTTQWVMPEQTTAVSDTWTPSPGQGSLLFGATSVAGGKGSYWNGWIDDSQLWPLARPDESVLRVIYRETVQDQQFAGSTLRVVNVGSGHCLDIAGGSVDNGADVRQWTCNAEQAQDWRFEDVGEGYYRLVNPRSGRCLDVDSTDGAGTADGRNVWQYDCNGGDSQKWKPVPQPGGHAMVAKISGKCLDVVGGSPNSGANVQQWSCGKSDAQLWSITRLRRHSLDGATRRLTNDNSAKCLIVDRGSTADGAEVWQAPCAGNTGESWRFVHAGDGYYFLISSHTADTTTPKCLDVAGGSNATQAGANVHQWGCNWGDWQKWKVMPVGGDGTEGYRLIAKHSGMALDVAGASQSDGADGNVIQHEPLEPVPAHQQWTLR